MDLTPAQLAWLHAEVGGTATDADLQDRYDRLGSVRDVAIEVLTTRRTALLDNPLDVNVSGVASVGYSKNVDALERRIKALVNMDDDPSNDAGGGEVAALGGGPVEVMRLTRSRGR